jgi:hypothetical protein
VRMIRDLSGRFEERPYYREPELDVECEQTVTEFLTRRNGKATWPISTDDLTKLLEENVRDLDLYADLSGVGESVEGVTEFVPGLKPRVKICKDLASSPKHENRLRTTLTHELGHVRLHGYLFQLNDRTYDLFPKKTPHAGHATNSPASQECRRETILDSSERDWMEWQAGYACGAYLMPRSVLVQAVTQFRRQRETIDDIRPDSSHGIHLIELISTRFCVSRDAARVRLLKMKVLTTTPSPSILDPR